MLAYSHVAREHRSEHSATLTASKTITIAQYPTLMSKHIFTGISKCLYRILWAPFAVNVGSVEPCLDQGVVVPWWGGSGPCSAQAAALPLPDGHHGFVGNRGQCPTGPIKSFFGYGYVMVCHVDSCHSRLIRSMLHLINWICQVIHCICRLLMASIGYLLASFCQFMAFACNCWCCSFIIVHQWH